MKLSRTVQLARQMRRAPTPAEERLWQHIRRRQLGAIFRRQHPFGAFVFDFYAPAARLVVEVDGSVHDSVQARGSDAERTARIESLGIRVVRFRNDDVMQRIDWVLDALRVLISESARRA